MSGSDVPAIVFGAANPAGITIIQALGPHGIPIHALSNMDHAAGWYSKYTTARHQTPLGVGGSRKSNNVVEPDELLDYLVDHFDGGVVFPGGDANTRFLAHHERRLLDEGLQLCIPDEHTLDTAMDKSQPTILIC